MERMKKLLHHRYMAMAVPFIMLAAASLLFGTLTGGSFLTAKNLNSIFEQGLVVAVCAMGIAFIYTTGNVDMSVGAIIMLSGIIGGKIFLATGSVLLLFLSAFACAAVMQFLNGLISTILGLRTMVAAILMTQIYNAVSQQVLGATFINIYKAVKGVASGSFRYVLFTGLFIIFIAIYHGTSIGRSLRFIGGNERCAKAVGMDKKIMIRISYIFAAIAVGMASVFSLIRTGNVTATPNNMGSDIMLATVLGGMSIFGGYKSNVYSGVIGAFTVIVLSNGLLMLGVDASVIQGVKGVIFLAVVYLNSDREDLLPHRNQFT
ncbi:ABC transporter permease [Clostridium sp. MCC353]|uniref:ABC transporter permease n=1 Tax=Clostridium sp. MCC353 TaxID=2592646 RepID=UPI001C019271|nr:ABC transporter permease [Clostridium sp. MCC353]